MNNLYKIFNIVFVVLVVILSIMFFVLLGKYNKQRDEFIKQTYDYAEQIDSLEKVIAVSEKKIAILRETLLEQKERVVYIKVRNDEKVDSVYCLPVDGAIEFFANSISKETGSGR